MMHGQKNVKLDRREEANSLFYAFFWVIPRRLKFICRRFGTLCPFHLHRQVGVPKRRHINFRRRGITQKKAYNIQYTAKV